MSAVSAGVTACVPCYNDETTLGAVLDSIRRQTTPVAELLVIDDGSTDRSAALAAAHGARVVAHAENLGRGAARARGVMEAMHPFVLFVDANGVIPPDFVTAISPWFDDENVSAACTRIDDPSPRGLAHRWRARHLYRTGAALGVEHGASLMTSAVMLRRSAVLAVGNFDASLRQREDAELGRRLAAAGWDIVFDPRPAIRSIVDNTLGEVLERHWRWNLHESAAPDWSHYLKTVSYSIKVMVREDLAAGDVAAACISLVTPHYSFWRSFGRREKTGAAA